MNETKIQWTDFSANPIKYRDANGKIVWACAKVSDGCKNCYSEAIAHRYQRGGPFTLQQLRTVTPYFDDVEAGKILRSKKLAGKRVFIGDMTDVFGEWVPLEILDKLFAMFALRPDVTFQVLTKRPERMAAYLAEWTWETELSEAMRDRWDAARQPFYRQAKASGKERMAEYIGIIGANPRWPLPNVWLGTSCENQKTADERIPHLLQCPAAIRFISAEPLLGAIDLRNLNLGVGESIDGADDDPQAFTFDCLNGTAPDGAKLDWVIVGGESGHGARPCGVHWVRSIIKQCQAAGVPVFNKQLGSNCRMELTNGECGDRIKLESHKGGDPEEWLLELRVREMPRAAALV